MNSKTLYLIVSTLLLFSINTRAQEPAAAAPVTKAVDPATFKLGFCFMPQSTFILNSGEKDDPSATPMWKKGFMTGLTAGVVFTDKLSFDFGVLYSKQGVDYSVWTPFYAPITLSYIKIPLTLNYRPFMKHNIPVEFTGGFQYSGLAKAVIEMPHGWYLPGEDKQWFNPALVDVVAGVGFNFRMVQNLFMNTKFRMDYSLGDPINRDYVYNQGGSSGSHWKSDRSPSRNITLGFLIGLEYHFGKK